MFIFIEPQHTGTSDGKALKAQVTPEVLKLFPLTENWKKIEGLYEDIGNFYNRKVPGWGRLVGDKQLLVLNLHRYYDACGDRFHWQIYLDGVFVHAMTEYISERAAMDIAEVYLKSDKLRYILKFEDVISNIIQQYGKEHGII